VLPQTSNQQAAESAYQRRVMVATSSGIRQIKHLSAFLTVDEVVSPAQVTTSDVVEGVVVWGRKGTATKALKYAKNNDLNVIFLEDGWVRSASSNAHNRFTYSLLVDNVGVYYDATKPSQLEQLLNLPDAEFAALGGAQELAYAEECRKTLVESNITKYNYCRQSQLPDHDRPIVVVVDQTQDDASVRLGGMNAKRFEAMLLAAVKENPQADIMVRTHPDVVAGRRRGYLTKLADKLGVLINASGDNPLPWLKRADRVYVATSQLGYEALLCGSSVTVFGQPFYAGWGLTDDRQPIERRTAKRSVNELFYISHIKLARYVNPVNAEVWQLLDCLKHVQLQQRYFEHNAKAYHCVGITPWKRRFIRQYLRSPQGKVTFSPAKAASADAVYATWSFRKFSADRPRTEQGNDAELVRLEDGFIRSNGLGSDFTAPGSLVVDSQGIYFDPTNPSDLEQLLNFADCTPADIRRAARLRQQILKAGLSKYNVGQVTKNFAKSAVKDCVLVIGQVEDDASIQLGCDAVGDNTALLKAVREARPDAYVVYKPHPDVLAGNRKGSVAEPLQWADEVNTHSSITAGLEWCDELHTMTSLAGFEALMRGKRVVTYGLPFYAGWGLTQDSRSLDRRKRRRTLDELVYMTLIEYPRYVDIASGDFITPELMVARLEQQKSDVGAPPQWLQRQLTKVVNIVLTTLPTFAIKFVSTDCNANLCVPMIDRFFYRRDQAMDYSGNLREWESYLDRLIVNKEIGRVYLFGDCRSYHRVAKRVAKRRGIRLFVFEEGYIRPNYITLEENGVNGHSPLMGKSVDLGDTTDAEEDITASFEKDLPKKTFFRSAICSILYYWACRLQHRRFPKYQHHRSLKVVAEGARWIRSGFRKLRYQRAERDVLEQIVTEFSDNYFVVPLQVHCDMQVVVHSKYNSIEHFIGDVLTSFSRHAAPNKAIVFKHHPMDRAYTNYSLLFENLVGELGLQGRVFYVHDVCLPSLLKSAEGTVLINSTVGMSSLFHGTPVKTLGKAIYDIPGLTTQRSLESFWRRPGSVDRGLFVAFRQYLINRNQINGSFIVRLAKLSGAGLLWSDTLSDEHSYVPERLDLAPMPPIRVVAGLDYSEKPGDDDEKVA